MKLNFSASLTLLFLLLVNINNAQIENDNKINYLEFNGKVVNSENKEPLVFANINLIGSNVSTISNSDGDFTDSLVWGTVMSYSDISPDFFSRLRNI